MNEVGFMRGRQPMDPLLTLWPEPRTFLSLRFFLPPFCYFPAFLLFLLRRSSLPAQGLPPIFNRSLSHSGRRLQSAGAGWSSVLSLLKTILAESKKMRIFKLDMFIELLGAQPTLTSTLKMNNLLCFIKWDIIHSTKVDGKSHWRFLVPQDFMMLLLNRKCLSTQCERAKP